MLKDLEQLQVDSIHTLKEHLQLQVDLIHTLKDMEQLQVPIINTFRANLTSHQATPMICLLLETVHLKFLEQTFWW